VARVRFDRLDKKNAITAQMYLQLAEALAAADADPEVCAILLHGSADCFTSGNSRFNAARKSRRDATPASFGRALQTRTIEEASALLPDSL